MKSGFTLPILTTNQLIHLYSKHGLINEAQKLFDEMPQRNIYSWNTIISAHVKSQNLAQAKSIFDSASVRDLVTYNSMISGYVDVDGYERNALELFVEMHSKSDDIGIDDFTVTSMVKLFAKLSNLCYGRQLHSYLVKTGNDRSGFVVSSLIDMYSKCGCYKEACGIFRGCEKEGGIDLVSKNAMVAACCREGEMEMALGLFWRENDLNDSVSWNTLISGYVQNGYPLKALKLFVCMGENGVKWNEHTFGSVLSACADLRNLKIGKEMHAWILKNGLSSSAFVESGIVDVYCKCGNMKYAESLHLTSGIGSSFSITSMIVGYSSQGNMMEACRLFDSLEEKNYIVWAALFSGYVKLNRSEAIFELLSLYIATEAAIPDALILVSALSVCAFQAALGPGKQIHGYVYRMGVEMDIKMTTAMIDMYSKCGSIPYAEKMFLKVIERDLVLHNVMIAGYAHHGYEIKAINLFQEMLEGGVGPDAITFVALLSACRHRGLVDLGERTFYSMTEDYHILPETDHYACMIDLYGRASELEKMVLFMQGIPIEYQDAAVVGAFLNACRLNKSTELAREAEEKLLKIEGDSGARYVQLANAYAAEGNWAEMGRIRKGMRGKEAKKFAGCSWVYLDNGVHTFVSGDRTHSKAVCIYSMLDFLTSELYEIARHSDGELETWSGRCCSAEKMSRSHDLNRAMNENDDDLLRNVDNAEVDVPSFTAEGEDFDTIND
ncbi:hypothetical protein OIU77_028938 [Salix suchowensis]|uniref:Pentatricopeptide repeat-containing protein n=1 Tax=Salix suchowensis TaxID=1278906 RepID=A0ABQ9BJ60_9ROSI|nr:hypothetical protein OIU77_028938 [Salix suchowensis]